MQPVTAGYNPSSEVTFRAKNLLRKTKPKNLTDTQRHMHACMCITYYMIWFFTG